MALPSRFAGEANAVQFAYGVAAEAAGLQVLSAPVAAGVGSVTLALGQVSLGDGTTIVPLNTNAPITIGGGQNQETVTPSAVSTGSPAVYGTTSFTATFANVHGIGDVVRSGTLGLQEAINFMAASGGGVVVVDSKWASLGGTSAMIAAATVPATVAIVDRRTGQSANQTATFTITAAQLKAMYATPVQLLPAPGAGFAYVINNVVFNYLYTAPQYTGGGAIQLSYSDAAVASAIAATGTLAATFLTSPTANQVALVSGALASSLGSAIENEPISMSNASAAFAAGGGSLVVEVSYRVIGGLA